MENNEQYFNTTSESGETLKKYTATANSQTGIILSYFRKINKPMTPSEVHYNLFDDNTPLTSIRRSITCLTNCGILIKTETQKKEGVYGRPEYYWELDCNKKMTEDVIL